MTVKPAWVCFGLLIVIFSASASEPLQVSLGYGRFSPSDPRYEKVYTSGREIYSLEIAQPLFRSGRHTLGLSGGLRRFVKKGHSTLTQDPARLTLHPVSLGLRYTLDFESFRPWGQIGLDRVLYKEESPLRNSSGSTFGYHVEGGISVHLPEVDFLGFQILVRHSRAAADRNSITVNLGGFEYSLGLVFEFEIF